MQSIIVIFKLHDTSPKGITSGGILINIGLLSIIIFNLSLIFGVLRFDDHTLFQKLSCTDYCICIKSFLIFQGWQAFNFFTSHEFGSHIWIFVTPFESVAILAAAHTPFIFHCIVQIVFQSFVIILVFGYMAWEFATEGFLRWFATTPPHFTWKLWVMSSTGPIEVVRVFKVFATVFTDFRLFNVTLLLL